MLMFNNLIDGEWLSDGARAPNVNPSDTKDIVGEAVRGTRAQAEAAIAAAKAAFPAWSRSTPQARYDILKKASDEILARKDELHEHRVRAHDRSVGACGVVPRLRRVLRVCRGYRARPRCRFRALDPARNSLRHLQRGCGNRRAGVECRVRPHLDNLRVVGRVRVWRTARARRGGAPVCARTGSDR